MREKVLQFTGHTPKGTLAFLGHGEAQANNIFCSETKEYGQRNMKS